MKFDPRLPQESTPQYDRIMRARLYEIFRDIYGRFNADGSFSPAQLSNDAAPNNAIYYSTTDSKLSYKTPAGTVVNLH